MPGIDDLAGTLMGFGDETPQWAQGTVSAVASGGAADGNSLCTVSWRGRAVKAAYASSYTPVVGHVVLMARVGPQLAIVCRLIGTPPSS